MKARQFHQALSRLVSLNAIATLEYVLDQARELEQMALAHLPHLTDTLLIVLDPDNAILAINEAAARLEWATPAELVGTRVWQSESRQVGDFRRNIVTLARERNCQFHYLDNLSDRWYETDIVPLGDGVMLVRAHDITDGASFYFSGGHAHLVATGGTPRIIE